MMNSQIQCNHLFFQGIGYLCSPATKGEIWSLPQALNLSWYNIPCFNNHIWYDKITTNVIHSKQKAEIFRAKERFLHQPMESLDFAI